MKSFIFPLFAKKVSGKQESVQSVILRSDGTCVWGQLDSREVKLPVRPHTKKLLLKKRSKHPHLGFWMGGTA